VRLIKAAAILIAEFVLLFVFLLTVTWIFPDIGQGLYRFSQSEGGAKNVIGGILFFVMVSGAWKLAGRKKKSPPPLPGSLPPVITDTMAAGISDTKKCPKCAETIKLEAIVCRFCNHAFSENEVTRDKQEIEAAKLMEKLHRINHQISLNKKPRLLDIIWGPILLGFLLGIPTGIIWLLSGVFFFSGAALPVWYRSFVVLPGWLGSTLGIVFLLRKREQKKHRVTLQNLQSKADMFIKQLEVESPKFVEQLGGRDALRNVTSENR